MVIPRDGRCFQSAHAVAVVDGSSSPPQFDATGGTPSSTITHAPSKYPLLEANQLPSAAPPAANNPHMLEINQLAETSPAPMNNFHFLEANLLLRDDTAARTPRGLLINREYPVAYLEVALATRRAVATAMLANSA